MSESDKIHGLRERAIKRKSQITHNSPDRLKSEQIHQLNVNLRLIVSGVKETASGLINTMEVSNYDQVNELMQPFDQIIVDIKALQTLLVSIQKQYEKQESNQFK